MTHATDEDGGGPVPEPTLSDDEVIVEAIAEHLREYGARLCDGQFFSMMVQPLYEVYGTAAVDLALREIYGDIRRRAASQIRDLRGNAAALKREQRTT